MWIYKRLGGFIITVLHVNKISSFVPNEIQTLMVLLLKAWESPQVMKKYRRATKDKRESRGKKAGIPLNFYIVYYLGGKKRLDRVYTCSRQQETNLLPCSRQKLQNSKGTLLHMITKMFILCLETENACLHKSTLFQSQNFQRKRAIFILSSRVREAKRFPWHCVVNILWYSFMKFNKL